MQYRSEIDGLRAVAVVPVILFHAGFTIFSGGFAGVDVFFVISGYLISSLILADADKGRFSLLDFYERRARRILPALFLVMLACLPVAVAVMTPGGLKTFAKDAMGVALFASNMVFWKQSSYFEPASALNPLLHTWSLAIEEQFYLFFPLIVMLVWPRRRRLFAPLMIVALIASLALAQWASAAAPAAGYYLMVTRAWELLAGVCVTLACRSQASRAAPPAAEALAASGLLLILLSIFLLDDTTPYPSLYTVPPVAGTALIIAFARPGGWTARLLSVRPLVFIGLISYSAYLWHQPLFAFARILGASDTNHVLFASLTALTILLAWLSWRYVETPFRDRRWIARPRLFVLAGAGSACLLALGALGNATNGGDFRFTPEQKAVFAAYANTDSRFTRSYGQDICFLSAASPHPVIAPQCYADIIGKRGASIIWGDSHGASMSIGLLAQFGGAPKAQFTYAGCPPVLHYQLAGDPRCAAVNNASFRQIGQAVAPRIFVIADWFIYQRRPNFPAALSQTIRALKDRGAEVILIGSLPQWRPSLPDLVVSRMTQGGLDAVPPMLPVAVMDQLRDADRMVEAAARANDVRFISLLDTLCEDHRCRAIIGAPGAPHLVAWDYGHLTPEGSLFDARMLMRRLGPNAALR